MDHRDQVHWEREAARVKAQRKLDMIQAVCAAHLKQEELTELVADLRKLAEPYRLTDTLEAVDSQPTEAQEAEWAQARRELLGLVGRAK